MKRMRWPPGSDEEVRKYLASVIIRCAGNLKKIAWEIGIGSRHKLWKKLYLFRLWPIVNAARRDEAERLLRLKRERGGR